jgi:predicted TIM-barrel fold metal-dependent hydrolase
VDIHAHINGKGAAPIWREVARLFGVSRVFTMVRLSDAPTVREALGDMVRFIAFPDFRGEDRSKAFKDAFLEDIRRFHGDYGARIVKLWNAPRLRELITGDAAKDLIEFDSPWRVKAAELAQSLGMMMMVHVADPDTWFATRYKDAAKFGTKLSHYRGLEVMLDRFPMPWIAAHMGGWPENLPFLSGMLERHPNLYIDTSATKWVVRELSKHKRDEVLGFFTRWRGRLLFGSDIVTTDEHLAPKAGPPAHPMADLASSPETAFDLYASRYYALRTMFETNYNGESPIADPDLKMVEPDRYDDMAAPRLQGLALPRALLEELYHNAAARLLATVGVSV